jgi:hypothetical protein
MSMSPRSWLLFLVSGLVGAFYLLSPMAYTYFWAAYVFSFNAAPGDLRRAARAMLDVWPISLWGAVVEVYGEDAEHPVTSRNLVCQLKPGGQARKEEVSRGVCRLIVPTGAVAYGPYATLKGGLYVAQYDLDVDDRCAGGEVELRVSFSGGQDVVAAAQAAVHGAAQVRVPFAVSGVGRILQGWEMTTTANAGCAIVRGVSVETDDRSR